METVAGKPLEGAEAKCIRRQAKSPAARADVNDIIAHPDFHRLTCKARRGFQVADTAKQVIAEYQGALTFWECRQRYFAAGGDDHQAVQVHRMAVQPGDRFHSRTANNGLADEISGTRFPVGTA